MDLVRLFSENVKSYRLKKNISQEKLAELSNLHRTYISDVECCRRNASLKSIQKIAEALGVEPYVLLLSDKES